MHFCSATIARKILEVSTVINRAAELWRNWEDKQQMLQGVFNGDAVAADLSRQQYDFLTQGMHRINAPSSDEKMVLELIKRATGKLERKLYPIALIRILHKVKELLYDKPFLSAKMDRVKTNDVFRLKSTLNKMGIAADKLNLPAVLDYQRVAINLKVSSPYGTSGNLELSLHLEKDSSDRYQLDSYTATLKSSSLELQDRSYSFPVSLNVAAKDALNLLEGRAVFKQDEGKQSGNWLQLDFKSVDQKGQPVLKSYGSDQGFERKKELAVLAGELNRGELSANGIQKGLEAGKQVMIKPVLGDALFIEANPVERGILLKNEKQQPITLTQLKQEQAQQQLEREASVSPARQFTFEKQKPKEADFSFQISS